VIHDAGESAGLLGRAIWTLRLSKVSRDKGRPHPQESNG
jgi:hypothetical protein